MEKKLERKEREERKNNIMIKGMKEKEGKRKEMVEGIITNIGMEVEVRKVKRLGGDKERRREMVMVKLGNEEQKKEVIKNKKKLKERKEKIIKDWTWKERKMRWKLKEIVKNEERKEK